MASIYYSTTDILCVVQTALTIQEHQLIFIYKHVILHIIFGVKTDMLYTIIFTLITAHIRPHCWGLPSLEGLLGILSYHCGLEDFTLPLGITLLII